MDNARVDLIELLDEYAEKLNNTKECDYKDVDVYCRECWAKAMGVLEFGERRQVLTDDEIEAQKKRFNVLYLKSKGIII